VGWDDEGGVVVARSIPFEWPVKASGREVRAARADRRLIRIVHIAQSIFTKFRASRDRGVPALLTSIAQHSRAFRKERNVFVISCDRAVGCASREPLSQQFRRSSGAYLRPVHMYELVASAGCHMMRRRVITHRYSMPALVLLLGSRWTNASQSNARARTSGVADDSGRS